MNWKHEAIDKLKLYEAKKNALRTIPEELRRLELNLAAIRSSTCDGTPVKEGGSGREDMLLNNIVAREEAKKCLEDARTWVQNVDRALAILSEGDVLVLDRFYIHPARGNVDRLCGELSCEQSSVYRRRDAAIRHFTVALYGCCES